MIPHLGLPWLKWWLLWIIWHRSNITPMLLEVRSKGRQISPLQIICSLRTFGRNQVCLKIRMRREIQEVENYCIKNNKRKVCTRMDFFVVVDHPHYNLHLLHMIWKNKISCLYIGFLLSDEIYLQTIYQFGNWVWSYNRFRTIYKLNWRHYTCSFTLL